MSDVITDDNYMYCVVSDVHFRKVLSSESWEVCVEEGGCYEIAFTIGKDVDATGFLAACEFFVETRHKQNLEDC